jgi:hypothetical protein
VPDAVDPKLARQLVLDELFDLSLYRALRDVATGDPRAILEQLIPSRAGTTPSGRTSSTSTWTGWTGLDGSGSR